MRIRTTLYLRRLIRERLETQIRATFWPVVDMKSGFRPFAVGVNQQNTRVGGRVWVTGRGSKPAIVVSISYRSRGSYTSFECGEDPAGWDGAILMAFCWLREKMEYYDVEWVTPDTSLVVG